MLILTRRIGEEIIISDDITVVIVQVTNGQVKLGITAPKEVKIMRKEVLLRDANQSLTEPGAVLSSLTH